MHRTATARRLGARETFFARWRGGGDLSGMQDDRLSRRTVERLVERDSVRREIEREDREVLVGGQRAGGVARHVLGRPGEHVRGGVELDIALGARAGLLRECVLADDGRSLVGALAGITDASN